ncbi:Na/Pi cotransporter family protein [Deinococcus cellulosilyticus]|uniref:Na/Pi cotransporter II-like protein n=1 Tax=Deinococcus cellulosilyticus (strain DSM 18568 / NBRC 106333 / KACC 11606 / 5516J-15) TaxID=1223518 RepID=A0A511N8V0_DEIC1|nr:Na/Pi symporter [Deinococcus cellulosilyticus]GEM49269.1 Na/Pi cotransporter II-like protein [Deinococcus cellulosilyticus NBRC 106333 = KACC 11606]
MFLLLTGLALFLYGVSLAGSSLQALLGKGMRRMLARVTRSTFGAALVGTVVTAVAQSGTMITVLTVEFVNAGILRLRQALVVALAAGIGGTLTVQLLALDLENIQYPLIGASLLLSSKRILDGKLGQTLLGFGLLFLGLDLLMESLEPLKNNSLAQQIIALLADHPLTLTLFGVFLAAVLLQSSNATATLGLAFLSGGLISEVQSIALIVGANIGTTVSAVTASLNSNVDARRAAIGHLILKILFGAVVVVFAGQVAGWISSFSSGGQRFVANMHTLFNVLVLLAVIPFLTPIVRLLERFIPTPPDPHAPKHLDLEKSVRDPELLYGLALRETVHIAERTEHLYATAILRLQGKDVQAEVESGEKHVDRLVNTVVITLGRLTGKVEESRLSALLLAVNELEAIADLCKRLVRQPRKLERRGYRFSSEGEQELLESAQELREHMVRCVTSLSERRNLVQNEEAFEKKLIAQRVNHLHRLSEKSDSRESSSIHLDVMTVLEQIHSGFNRVARLSEEI